jgi:hypothetical protein
LVEGACDRILAGLSIYAPYLGEQVRLWMACLSPSGRAPDYFLLPSSFPLLQLPWWAAKTFTAEPDLEFLKDVLYSTMNGYYYIRLLDNLMDGHGTVELKILPATAFFHTEFQSVYQKYFQIDHPFWEVFRSSWFSGSDAVARELDLSQISRLDFERVTVVKLAATRIPMAAVCFRYRRDHLRLWEEFALALARWSQLADDLFDWHEDMSHGKTSYFLSQANSHEGFDSVEAWVIYEGFQRGIKTLQRELSALRLLVPPLHSSDVVNYLNFREVLLQEHKVKVSEAFQSLRELGAIIQAGTQL